MRRLVLILFVAMSLLLSGISCSLLSAGESEATATSQMTSVSVAPPPSPKIEGDSDEKLDPYCTMESEPETPPDSYQLFEHGALLVTWQPPGCIPSQGWTYPYPKVYILLADGAMYELLSVPYLGDFNTAAADWDAVPPESFFVPTSSHFDMVWRIRTVRNALGWAVKPEIAGSLCDDPAPLANALCPYLEGYIQGGHYNIPRDSVFPMPCQDELTSLRFYQRFEGGEVFNFRLPFCYLNEGDWTILNSYYVLYPDGTFEVYDISVGDFDLELQNPPEGLFAPGQEIEPLWAAEPEVRMKLGWGTQVMLDNSECRGWSIQETLVGSTRLCEPQTSRHYRFDHGEGTFEVKSE